MNSVRCRSSLHAQRVTYRRASLWSVLARQRGARVGVPWRAHCPLFEVTGAVCLYLTLRFLFEHKYPPSWRASGRTCHLSISLSAPVSL